MNFYDVYQSYKTLDFDAFFQKITDSEILEAINKDNKDIWDFLRLLSPKAEAFLEPMAKKAHDLTIQHFGKTITLYTPIYISNYCDNICLYCGYSKENKIMRKQLSLEEIEQEAKEIHKTGLRHILVLTGESRRKASFNYIVASLNILKKYFNSISIEIYALKQEEYTTLANMGIRGVTLYQETYNELRYDALHVEGPKKNYQFRLETPERVCMSGMEELNIGVLLGLSNFRKDTFFTALHGKYLQDKYIDVEVGFSVPRIRPCAGSTLTFNEITDKNIVQAILAYRLYMPRCGINISTRENAMMRNHLIPLGVTKMSAGVCTEVGGHALTVKSESQFSISDTRTVQEMMKAIRKQGYDSVLKDWSLV